MMKRPFQIYVPNWAIEHFWEEPPPGHREFWAFQYEPNCKAGDHIYFQYAFRIIAKAVVSEVVPPGRSSCERTNRYLNHWKVYWTNESFIDMRNLEPELFQQNNISCDTV